MEKVATGVPRPISRWYLKFTTVFLDFETMQIKSIFAYNNGIIILQCAYLFKIFNKIKLKLNSWCVLLAAFMVWSKVNEVMS